VRDRRTVEHAEDLPELVPGARLTDVDLVGVDLSGRTLSHLVLGDGLGAAATLVGVDLSGAVLRSCVLTGAVLRDVRLRGATLQDCDLRYVDLERVQLTGARLVGCDLYRARLGTDTILTDARVVRSSLNRIVLDGATLDRSVVGPQLLQEDPQAFRQFHQQIAPTAGHGERVAGHLAAADAEAAGIYRDLSGYWDSRGQHRDAAWAYVSARRAERRHARPWAAAARASDGHEPGRPLLVGLRSAPSWIGSALADAVAGHGERPLRAIACLGLLALVFALLFDATGSVGAAGDGGLGTALLDSARVLTTTLPDDRVRDTLGAWLVALETGLGIVLLGLLGFVLGNRLRHH